MDQSMRKELLGSLRMFFQIPHKQLKATLVLNMDLKLLHFDGPLVFILDPLPFLLILRTLFGKIEIFYCLFCRLILEADFLIVFGIYDVCEVTVGQKPNVVFLACVGDILLELVLAHVDVVGDVLDCISVASLEGIVIIGVFFAFHIK